MRITDYVVRIACSVMRKTCKKRCIPSSTNAYCGLCIPYLVWREEENRRCKRPLRRDTDHENRLFHRAALSWVPEDRVDNKDRMKCVSLLAEEVVPALREYGKELGLSDPYEHEPGMVRTFPAPTVCQSWIAIHCRRSGCSSNVCLGTVRRALLSW
jgi:hypothetical protein